MRATRLGRWILPASGLSLALAGVLGLVALEFQDSPGLETQLQASTARALPASDDDSADWFASQDAAAAQRAEGTDPRAQGQGTRRAPRKARRRGRRAPAPRRELGAPMASQLVRDLADAEFAEQERILDRLIAKSPRDASQKLRDLLGQDLPGQGYPARRLRLAILSRVGKLDDALAEQTLVDHIAPNKPRPQRLLALGLIRARPRLRPHELEAVAREDHDAVVQAKARRVMGYGYQ